MTPGQAIYEQANPHPDWPWARLTGREQAGWEHAAKVAAHQPGCKPGGACFWHCDRAANPDSHEWLGFDR